MPTLHRRNPTQGANSGPLRSSLADAAWQVEDRLVWGSAERLRGAGQALGRPFQRAWTTVQERVVWPLEERTMYWGQPVRVGAVVALGALLTAGVAVAIVALAPSTKSTTIVSSAAAPAAATTTAGVSPAGSSAEPTGPVLHGSKPEFTPEAGGGVPKAHAGKNAIISSNGDAAAGTSSSASSSSKAPSYQGGAAGQAAEAAAVKVARQFAGAFVLYETGRGRASVVRTIFSKTATPELTRALLRRPPRLPANVKVPKAKVLNIVPGPSQGGGYILSISLLRLGVTSQLKVEMRQAADGRWQVADSLG